MQNNTRQTLKIFLSHLNHYKVAVFTTVISIIGGCLVNVIIPLYFRDFFNIISADTGQKNVIGLFGVLITIAILEIISWCFWRLGTFSAIKFQTRILSDLYNSCFTYLHKHSIGYFENTFVGSLVKRVTKFAWAFVNIADVVLWNLLNLLVNIIFITFILFLNNKILGLAILIWIAIFLTINYLFSRYKLKYDIAKSEAETEITRILADTITNQANVKFFNGYNREVGFFSNAVEKMRKLRYFTWTLSNIFESIQGVLMIILEISILYYGIRLWERGDFSVGDFVLLQSYALIIFQRVWDFGRVVRSIYENLSDAEEMTEIFLTPHSIKDQNNAKKLKIIKGEIKFIDTTFCYHKTRCVLNKINFTIKPGEKIALVGPSGAGKSTIIKLLLRMYDLTGGKILIDGQKIKEVTQESLWHNISMVPQDPILFHRTLMENIRYGRWNASNEDVIKASKLAHCHDFIANFDEGYETKVGERGIKLSGGERQRVAIARAILRNSPILVLDEATSSLDSHSERLIQKALDYLMKDKTVIIVAHRLSTVMKADRILVIDKGGIIEEGKHQELINKKNGVYRKHWNIQVGGFIK